MTVSHLKRTAEIIQKIIYITIASVSKDGQPWNSPVYSAFDKDLNFYWSSDKESVHSKNIRENRKVFLIIYDSTMAEGTGEGVYIQAEAFEITNKGELEIARATTQKRKGKKVYNGETIKFTGNNIRRIYKAVPNRVWMNDVEEDDKGNYIKDIRVEISLKDLLQLFK